MTIRLALVIIILLNTFSAGCNGSHEPDSYAYIVAMGIDKTEDPDKIKVTYQLAIPDVGQGTQKESAIISIQTVSLAESRNLLNSVFTLTPTLSHIKILILGEALARQGVQEILGPIVRYREYRGSMHVAIAKGTALDFFKNNQPRIKMSASKYYESMLQSAPDSGYFLDSSLNTFYLRMKSHSSQAYALMVAFNPTTGKDSPTKPKMPGGKAETYSAGEIPRTGGNNVDFMGTAIFRGDQMVGILDSDETRMLNMLLGNYKRGFLTVVDPLKSESAVNVNLRLAEPPSFQTQMINNKPYINIKLHLEGYISAIPSGINYEKEAYLSLLEEQVSQVITERMQAMINHTQQLGSDAAGLGDYFRTHFLTRPEFIALDWNDRYQQANISINVNTDLRRYGLMGRSSAIQGK